MLHLKKIFVFIVFIFLANCNAQEKEINTNQLNANGNRHGLWKGYYEDTKYLKYEGTFNDGKEVGTFTFYDNTKAKSIIATRVFQKDGSAYTTFFKGKFKVSEGLVVNKQYQGLWKTYHFESDQVMMLEQYKDGVLHGKKQVFYMDGDLLEESTYVNGLREGVYKKFARTGKVLEELNYKQGKLSDKAIYRDHQGNIESEGMYRNDLPIGEWKFYEKGKLVRTENKEAQRKLRKAGDSLANPTAEIRKLKQKPTQKQP